MAVNLESISGISAKYKPITGAVHRSSPTEENGLSSQVTSFLDILDPEKFNLEAYSNTELNTQSVFEKIRKERESSGILEEHKKTEERNTSLLNLVVEQPGKIGSDIAMNVYHNEKIEWSPLESISEITDRQQLTLEASRSLILINENNSRPIIAEDGSEISYDLALKGVRAVGGDTSHLSAESTNVGEVLINSYEDSVLEQSLSRFAKENNLDTGDAARILLAQREVFLTSDQLQESLNTSLEKIQGLDGLSLNNIIIAKGKPENIEGQSANQSSAKDQEEFKFFSTQGGELGGVSTEDALSIVAMALSLKAIAKDRNLTAKESQIINLAQSLNKVGIYVSNLRDEALIDGQDISPLKQKDNDKLNTNNNLKGTFISLESVFDPIAGEWVLKATQKSCPFKLGDAYIFLMQNFKRGEDAKPVLKKPILPFLLLKDRPFYPPQSINKRVGPLSFAISRRNFHSVVTKDSSFVKDSVQKNLFREAIKSDFKQTGIKLRSKDKRANFKNKGFSKLGFSPKSEDRSHVVLNGKTHTVNQVDRSHTFEKGDLQMKEKKFQFFYEKIDLKSIVIGRRLRQAFKEADESGVNTMSSQRTHTINLSVNLPSKSERQKPKTTNFSYPKAESSLLQDDALFSQGMEKDKMTRRFSRVDSHLRGLKDSNSYRFNFQTKEKQSITDMHKPLVDRSKVTVKDKERDSADHDIGREDNVIVFQQRTKELKQSSDSENISYQRPDLSVVAQNQDISYGNQTYGEAVTDIDFQRRGSFQKDSPRDDIDIKKEAENLASEKDKVKEELTENYLQTEDTIVKNQVEKEISSERQELERVSEMGKKQVELGTNERIDRTDTSGIVIQQTLKEQIHSEYQKDAKLMQQKHTIETTLHLALEPESNDNFPSSDQVKVKDFISSVLTQIDKSLFGLDQAA